MTRTALLAIAVLIAGSWSGAACAQARLDRGEQDRLAGDMARASEWLGQPFVLTVVNRGLAIDRYSVGEGVEILFDVFEEKISAISAKYSMTGRDVGPVTQRRFEVACAAIVAAVRPDLSKAKVTALGLKVARLPPSRKLEQKVEQKLAGLSLIGAVHRPERPEVPGDALRECWIEYPL